MIERLVVVAVLVVAAVVLALVVQRRRPDPPSGGGGEVPTQLDRGDFDRPDAPWLVAVFTSASCATCAVAWSRVGVLASADVAVDEIEVGRRPELHRRYLIDAVPTTVIADSAGVVVGSFLGPPPSAELWAAVATARDAPDDAR